MTTLTEKEQACLLAIPAFNEKPAIAHDSNTALRLVNRGLAVGKRVPWLNFPLVTRSGKGDAVAKAVAR